LCSRKVFEIGAGKKEQIEHGGTGTENTERERKRRRLRAFCVVMINSVRRSVPCGE
jgi:hypothetical protein